MTCHDMTLAHCVGGDCQLSIQFFWIQPVQHIKYDTSSQWDLRNIHILDIGCSHRLYDNGGDALWGSRNKLSPNPPLLLVTSKWHFVTSAWCLKIWQLPIASIWIGGIGWDSVSYRPTSRTQVSSLRIVGRLDRPIRVKGTDVAFAWQIPGGGMFGKLWIAIVWSMAHGYMSHSCPPCPIAHGAWWIAQPNRIPTPTVFGWIQMDFELRSRQPVIGNPGRPCF